MSLLDTGGRLVPREWIDYNGHMMDAYYFLAFTEATEAFLDHVGLGAAYRARTGSGIYTAESHLCFSSGVAEGATLTYRTQLLGHDAKRLHVFHVMTSADVVAATCELMFLHVSQDRVTPMPTSAAGALAALAAAQALVPRPEKAGRRIAMPVPQAAAQAAQGAGRPLVGPLPQRIRRGGERQGRPG
jgi:acyl-CoA thioester hydrolase